MTTPTHRHALPAAALLLAATPATAQLVPNDLPGFTIDSPTGFTAAYDGFELDRLLSPVVNVDGSRFDYFGFSGLSWGLALDDFPREETDLFFPILTPLGFLEQTNVGSETGPDNVGRVERQRITEVGSNLSFVENYVLQSDNQNRVTLTSSLAITNVGSQPTALGLEALLDFDVDERAGGLDLGQVTSGAYIQSGATFGTSVSVRPTSTAGAVLNEAGFLNFADTPIFPGGPLTIQSDASAPVASNLIDLDGPRVTDTPDAGNLAQLFGYDLSLAADETQTITLTADLTRANIVFPVAPDREDPAFRFFDDAPQTRNEAPRTYDPDFAVGYDYAIDEGTDNAFAELYLSAVIGDGDYLVEVTDPESPLFGQSFAVSAALPETGGLGEVIDFVDAGAADGVRAFRVTGIELDAEIDPFDPLGFPTGLTFVNASAVGFSQTSIVPEPATALLAGLGVLALAARRRERLR